MGRGNLMKIFDITRPLSKETPVYPSDTRPVFSQEEHAWYRISNLNLGSHTGTHIDAPAHCIGDGETIDRVSLDSLIGRCRVIDARPAGLMITETYLTGKLGGEQRILLKTAYSGSDSYDETYPALSPDAARFLMVQRIRCIGIDSPSVEHSGDDGTIHRHLLGNGCLIIEFLDLTDIPAGDYTMIALPLRLAGLDGSPARVVLMKEEGM
jgi:arylformamidase